MKKRHINNSLLLLMLCSVMFLFFSLTTFADDHDNAFALVKSGDIVPLSVILKRLGKIELGHIIEVELEGNRKKIIYEIKLVNKAGIVKKYIFDAKSGKLLRKKEDD